MSIPPIDIASMPIRAGTARVCTKPAQVVWTGCGVSVAPAPDHHRLPGGRAEDRQLVGHDALGTGCAAVGEGLAQRLTGRLELGDQLVVAGAERGHLVLEVEEAAYALDADAGAGELGDGAQALDVARGVAAAPATGAARRDQAHPLVGAQGLG